MKKKLVLVIYASLNGPVQVFFFFLSKYYYTDKKNWAGYLCQLKRG